MDHDDAETDALILAAEEVNRLMREEQVFDVRIEIRFVDDEQGNRTRRVEIVSYRDFVLASYTD
jgi:hypothetical protein